MNSLKITVVKMKINKKYLVFRILTFPLKLVFILFWNFLFCIVTCFKWVLYGSHEVYWFQSNSKDDFVKLIEQNEKIIKHFKL